MNLPSPLVSLADMVLPRVCVVCGTTLLRRERCICTECLADLPFTFFWTMPHNPMADAFNGKLSEIAGKYEYAASLVYYDGDSPYRLLPMSIKYRRRFDCAEVFGSMLGSRIASAAHFSDVDLVIPVPLHWMRRFRRGYNQAELLAVSIASRTGAPVRTDILVRCRRTVTQTRLSVEDKSKNVSGAFSVRPDAFASFPASVSSAPSEPSRVFPGHILLVDDVFTTGSTLSECYKVLRSAVPSSTRISVATLSFVGK